jgi:CIC family chloride channel protein
VTRPLFTRLLKLRLFLTERFKPGEAQITLFWAGLVGAIGGLSAPAFRAATDFVQWLLTDQTGSLVETARALPAWRRMCVPAAGGLLAGLVLHFGSRLARGRKAADYMEAIVLGDGVIRSRPSLVRIGSSMFSIGSGGSIGREGPMVQLAAMTASLIGRFASFSRPRLRLMVACGAAAGIASAYNAPIGGALFVAEIVLGSIAMESFGPLILASVMATVIGRFFQGGKPLFEVPAFHLVSYVELAPYLVLGLTIGLLAPWFLKLLALGTKLFSKWNAPTFVRMMAGGLIVGACSIFEPDVWGNGYNAVSAILGSEVLWTSLFLLLFLKLVATVATVGSGAVGGVFTPTLLVGAIVGSLAGTAIHHAWPEYTASPAAYALVGMGALLAATTHAPLMAILILFEMTLDYDIVLPLMLACVAAYTTKRAISPESIYPNATKNRPPSGSAPLDTMRVKDLMRPDPVCVSETATFPKVVETFVGNRHNNLYVVGDGKQFRGVIPLHEIKPYLNDPDLAHLVIAHDLMREEFPMVTPESSLRETLEKFSTFAFERLPVVDSTERRLLVGSISKTDLLLTLGGAARTSTNA